MPKLSIDILKKTIESAHVPAVAYSYAELQNGSETTDKPEVVKSSIACGKKDAQPTNTDMNEIDVHTRFPASSLSKIVFTYLVLRLIQDGKISLDTKLYDILPYDRFKVNGNYPDKAKELTVQHVLSHTTGLPNVTSDLTSALEFDPNSELGEKYAYSGEAIYYLQQVIEKKMAEIKGVEKIDLETLAQEYVFGPKALGMKDSTFLPQPETDKNLVKVHTELGKSGKIYADEPRINAAGSLLTTAEDFSKFIAAWLELMDEATFKKAFMPTEVSGFKKCGLGWHLYKNKEGELISYQYGENLNTRSFVAINVTTKKGAAFFTNSINGSSIAEQLLNSPDFAPIGNMQEVFKHLHYVQSDEPGWKETIAGKIAEDKGDIKEARSCFVKASNKAFKDESKRRRLKWFDKCHQADPEKILTPPLETFIGTYTNKYGSRIDISGTDSGLIYKEWGQEIKLVRISENEFLPEKDQSFKISLKEGRMKIDFVHGGPDMFLSKAYTPEQTSVQKLSTDWKAKIEALREECKNQFQNHEPPSPDTLK